MAKIRSLPIIPAPSTIPARAVSRPFAISREENHRNAHSPLDNHRYYP